MSFSFICCFTGVFSVLTTSPKGSCLQSQPLEPILPPEKLPHPHPFLEGKEKAPEMGSIVRGQAGGRGSAWVGVGQAGPP